jgi:hypothetical protein
MALLFGQKHQFEETHGPAIWTKASAGGDPWPCYLDKSVSSKRPMALLFGQKHQLEETHGPVI